MCEEQVLIAEMQDDRWFRAGVRDHVHTVVGWVDSANGFLVSRRFSGTINVA